MLTIHIDRVRGDTPSRVRVQRLSRVWVHVESREVAAGDVQTDLVTALEQQRGRIQLDREFVRTAGRQKLGFPGPSSIPAAYDAVGDIERYAFGKIRIRRIHVNQLGGEIRVG